MPSTQPIPDLAALPPTMLGAVILACAKPTMVWIARYGMPVDLPDGGSLTCKVFEADTLEWDDLVYVDGQRHVRLLRDEQYWEARFLGVAVPPGGGYLHVLPKERDCVERIRAAQCCLNQGILEASHDSDELRAFISSPPGVPKIIPKQIAQQAVRDGNIVPCAWNGNEWRATTSVAFLLEDAPACELANL
ncbi:MAG: hypothetical protein EPN72_15040 [Nevskiaceae bacterium]|nr:MAG: hypothetical protein EPN72_15040 [Nevskiaceae bacterium]